MTGDRPLQPTVRHERVQGDANAPAHGLPCARLPCAGRRWAALSTVAASALLVAGCSSVPSAINPVSWWHSLQGGAIAEQRPPPPGATDPYPNLASVPPAPAQPNRAALQQITDSLIADRTNAQHEAAAAPLADPSSPSASPGLFGTGSTPPPGPPGQKPKPGAPATGAPAGEAPAASGPAPAGPPAPGEAPPEPVASASMPAAPPPAAPPSKAPVAGVNSAPLPALAPPGETPADTTPLPTIAAAPPAAANVPGFAVPAPPAGPKPNTAAPKVTDTSVSVPFADGSAQLPPSASAPLQALAAKRGDATIAVVGYGEASAATPDAQSTALTLGLARAQAMATALTAAGVPAGSVQIDAQAIGHGGSARLVQ
jgi:outer membrane protein OmpA-like peptidoglycan-associated protein